MGTQKATVTFDVEHVRNLGQIARRYKGGLTSVEAEAFLALYQYELQTVMEQAGIQFINDKLR